jgi:hypothetical protein
VARGSSIFGPSFRTLPTFLPTGQILNTSSAAGRSKVAASLFT